MKLAKWFRVRFAALRSAVEFRVWMATSFVPIAGGDTQTLTNFDKMLKDLYVGPIVEQMNQKTYLLDQLERDSEHIDHTGRKAIVPLRVGRNVGRGSRADNTDLPSAGRQQVANAEITMRYHYFSVELSDPTIEASKRSEGAFISAMRLETEGVADDARKDIQRQAYGTGDGLLCSVVSTVASNTIPVDSVQYIQVGDPIDIRVKSNGNTLAAAITVVTRIGGTTRTIGITTTVSADLTHGFYLAGARNNEMDGLRNITAASTAATLHNISKGTAYWQGKEKSAASATAGESLFEQLADAVGTSGRGEVEAFLTTRGIRRRLADTYQSQKRFNDARAVEVHGGYSAIMVNEVPVVADDDCPGGIGATSGGASTGFAFGINKASLKWYELTQPGWLEQANGSILNLKDSTTTQGSKMNTWQGFFRWYAALGCHAPNRNGRIILCADDNVD